MATLIKVVKRGPLARFSMYRRGARAKEFIFTWDKVLQALIDGMALDRDINNFAQLSFDGEVLSIDFFWLAGTDAHLTGYKESVCLNPRPLREWFENASDNAEYKTLSLKRRNRVRIEFTERVLARLREVAANPIIRKKFGRAVARGWPERKDSRVLLDADFLPHSFFWQESGAHGSICGGLIFWQKDVLSQSRYEMHS